MNILQVLSHYHELYQQIARSSKNSLIYSMLNAIIACFGDPSTLKNFSEAQIHKFSDDWTEYIEALLSRDHVKFYHLLYCHYEEMRKVWEIESNISLSRKNLQDDINHTSINDNDFIINIASKLENMVVNGEYSIGDKLPSERELQEQLNAGRSSIREALKILQQKGLIISKRGANGGSFVCEQRIEAIRDNILAMLNFQNVNIPQYIGFRFFIDMIMFELFIKNYGNEDTSEIFGMIDAMRSLRNSSLENRRQMADLNINLCRKCYTLTKNPIIIWIYDEIREKFGYEELLYMNRDMDYDRLAVEWEEYMDALMHRDLLKFIHLTYEHYTEISEAVRS